MFQNIKKYWNKLVADYKGKNLAAFIKENIFESQGSPRTKALSVALGTFIAFSPFWGFQTFLAITLAVYFKLNKALSFTFSHLSLPPVIPFVVWLCLYIGGLFYGSTNFSIHQMNIEFAKQNLVQYLIGSGIVSVFMAGFLGLATYILLKNKNR